MAERIVVGSLVNECTFEIGKSSLANLNKFQKRIGGLKKQLGALTETMTQQAIAQIRSQRLMNNSLKRGIELYDKYTAAANKAYGASGRPRTGGNRGGGRRSGSGSGTGGNYSGAASIRNREEWIANQQAQDAFNQARRQQNQRALDEAALARRRDTISIGYSRHQETLGRYNISSENQVRLAAVLRRVSARFEQGRISAKRYNYELSRINRMTRRLGASSMTFMGILDAVHSKLMLGGAAFGIFQLGKSIAQVGMDFEGYQAGLAATTGSARVAAQTMQWLTDTSNNLGVSLKASAQEFMSLSAAGRGVLNMNQLRDVFESYTEYAKSLDVSTYRYQLGLLAINQMLSKGVVQSQEARRQLGENIAGSYQLIQKAVGLNGQAFDQAMRNGQLLSKDVLPKLSMEFRAAAHNGGGLDEALMNTRSAFARLGNAMTEVGVEIFDGGFGKGLTWLANSLSAVMWAIQPVAGFIGGTLRIAIETVMLPIRILADTFIDFAKFLGIDLGHNTQKAIEDIAGITLGIAALTAAMRALNMVTKAFMMLGFFKYLGKLAGVLGALKGAGWIKNLAKGVGRRLGTSGADPIEGGWSSTTAGAADVAASGRSFLMGGLKGGILGAIASMAANELSDKFLRWAFPENYNSKGNIYDQVMSAPWDQQMQVLRAYDTGGTSAANSVVKHIVDVQVHDDKVQGLVDASVRDSQDNDDNTANSHPN